MQTRERKNRPAPIRPFLLTREQAAAALGISKRTFEDVRAVLVARGMIEVRCGHRINVVVGSLEQLVTNAAKNNQPLF